MAADSALYDADAESAALGAMMGNKTALIECLNVIEPEMFSADSHRILFSTIQRMVEEGEPVDQLTVVGALRATGMLDKAGGPVGVLAHFEKCPSPVNARAYANTVRDRHTRRQLIKAAFKIKEAVQSASTSEEAAALSQAAVLSAAGERAADAEPTEAKSLAEWFVTDYYNADATARISYGLPALDAKTGGYAPGELIVVGGFQKEGKSFLSLQFLLAAARAGRSVGLFNLEMSKRAIMSRLAVMLGGVSHHHLKMRQLGLTYLPRFERNVDELAKLPFEIHTGADWTPARIRAMQISRRYDVVIIDHLHRFPSNPKWGETASITHNANACKNIAHEQCAVILLSQMTKPPERMYSKPNSSMLRGSGMIAAECDASYLLYRERDEFGNRTLDAKLLASDVRDGQGDYAIHLRFDPDTLQFQEKAS